MFSEIEKTFKFLVQPKRRGIGQLHTEHHSCQLMVKSTLIEEDEDEVEGKENNEVDQRELDPLFTGPLDQQSGAHKVTLSDPTTTTTNTATEAPAAEESVADRVRKQIQSQDQVKCKTNGLHSYSNK